MEHCPFPSSLHPPLLWDLQGINNVTWIPLYECNETATAVKSFRLNFWLLLLLLFNRSAVSGSLQTHGQSFLCPPLSPRICSNSCPLSQWCYLTISSSASPFCFYLQSFTASGSFPKCQLFTTGGQSTIASASALKVNQLQSESLGFSFKVNLSKFTFKFTSKETIQL